MKGRWGSVFIPVLCCLAAQAAGPDAAPGGSAAQWGQAAAIAYTPDEVRRRGWSLLASALSGGGIAAISDWYNEAEVFARDDLRRDDPRVPFPGLPIGAAATAGQRLRHLGDAPVITFVHYAPEAYEYVRRHRLHRIARLETLARVGPRDPVYPTMATIPSLPGRARVMMSAWWPVDPRESTPLPVWDPDDVPRPDGSNDYTSWRRVVAVAPGASPRGTARVMFAGRSFPAASRVGLARFVHLPVDARLAANLMADPGARKAALLALGRPLRAGDRLVLVAFHLMAPDTGKGTWATAWWHDQPDSGVFGTDRPDAIPGAWRNYLMDATVDPVLPLEPDGTPDICFNPWFEAKFPDGGAGNGLKSNCINCHERASYPTTAFLPVRRGAADPGHDPAFAAGRIRTARLWSLANPPAEPR